MTDQALNGSNFNLIPFGDGSYLLRLKKFGFHKGYKGGTKYVADCEVVESSRNDVKVGSTYNLLFGVGGTGDKQSIEDQKLRAFICGICAEDVKDKTFDSDQQVVDLATLFHNAKTQEETDTIAAAVKQVRMNNRNRTRDGKSDVTATAFTAA